VARLARGWRAPVSAREVEPFRDQLEGLLDLADEQLDRRERDRLRLVIGQRHGDWFAWVGGLPVQQLAERLIGLLEDADKELTPEQVRELESLIRKRLPVHP
jgi:hypothetical protein